MRLVWHPLYELGRRTDAWGTVWENVVRGMDSHPVSAPIEDWLAFEGYVPPDPLTQDSVWPKAGLGGGAAPVGRVQGPVANLAIGGELYHGHMFMRLFYLRGFMDLMIADFAQDDPHLPRLIKMVEDHNVAVIRRSIECGAELLSFGDDLGMQTALPMSPEMWRRYIKPSYDHILRGGAANRTCPSTSTPTVNSSWRSSPI